MASDKREPALGSLAEQAGIDTTVCELCEKPLNDEEPWREGLDGCGAHDECLKLEGIIPTVPHG